MRIGSVCDGTREPVAIPSQREPFMTIPVERTQALIFAEGFLIELAHKESLP